MNRVFQNYLELFYQFSCPSYLALRLLDALNGSGVDGDVAGLVAGEGDLAALLVALRDLLAVRRSQGILTDRALAPQVAKVPDAVVHAGDNVGLPAALARQTEGLVLAAKEEVGLVPGGGQGSGARRFNWHSLGSNSPLNFNSYSPINPGSPSVNEVSVVSSGNERRRTAVNPGGP